MEPLYYVHGKWTEEEYVRFNRFVLRHSMGRKYWSWAACLAVVCLLWFGAELYAVCKGADDWYVLFLPILPALICIWSFTRGIKQGAVRSYRKNKAIADLEYDVFFFEDRFREESTVGTVELVYDKLSGILVSPTNVYVMTGPNQGLSLRIVDLPEGALPFIQQIKGQYRL